MSGGFYQDVIGYFDDSDEGEAVDGIGCKECPPGKYVHPDVAPGKDITECTACPEGNDSNLFTLCLYREVPCFKVCHTLIPVKLSNKCPTLIYPLFQINDQHRRKNKAQ